MPLLAGLNDLIFITVGYSCLEPAKLMTTFVHQISASLEYFMMLAAVIGFLIVLVVGDKI